MICECNCFDDDDDDDDEDERDECCFDIFGVDLLSRVLLLLFKRGKCGLLRNSDIFIGIVGV